MAGNSMEFVYAQDMKKLEEYLDQLRTEFERDCREGGKASACHQLAEFYDHIDRAPDKARPLLQQLCHERNYANSCLSLGNMFLAGRGGFSNRLLTPGQ